MLEIRDDLVLPLQRHGNINLTRIASDRKFGACEYRSRCEEKNTEHSRLQHLQPKPRDDVRTTTNLAAATFEQGILGCNSTVRLKPRGQQARNKMSIVDVKRFYQQINTSGRDERASPWRGRDWMNAAFGETSSARAGFAHKPRNATDDRSSSHNRHPLAVCQLTHARTTAPVQAKDISRGANVFKAFRKRARSRRPGPSGSSQ
jgi:hypothetical protein